MELPQPRAVYHRLNTDESSPSADNAYELRSIKSIQSFVSSKIDQAPLLDYSPAYEHHGHPPSSIKVKLHSFFDRLIPRRLHGWKLGALGSSILAAFSLILNIIATIWLGTHKGVTGLVEVYRGDCGVVSDLDLWSHLAINVLSTLLLGGSNYCMQCLCAPTRADVDRAHQRRRFLDIGVPSLRNLRSIPRRKAILWWILALSSIPLHLLYNSAFYKSLATNDYDLLFVSQDFVDGRLSYNQTLDLSQTVNLTSVQQNITNPSRFERLALPDCLRNYASDFQSKRRNLVFVVSDNNITSNHTFLDVHHYVFAQNVYEYDDFDVDYGSGDPFSWICFSDERIREKVEIPRNPNGASKACSTFVDQVIALAEDSNWHPWEWVVDHCYSELVEETCSYSGNIPILAVVIVCNFIKMVGMFLTAFHLGTGSLLTIGDALASFLEDPDPHSKGRCLLSREEVAKSVRRSRYFDDGDKALPPKPEIARIQRRKWASVVSWSRWVFTMSLVLLVLIICSVLLDKALRAIREFGLEPMDLALGAVSPGAIIEGWLLGSADNPSQLILRSIVIANAPQAIFSFIYLNLNGLLTTMWLAEEWSDFAAKRKGLRTSKPRGQQRSTHFLQLPYQISLPLMLLSGLLHWLISQSIFLAVVAEYTNTGELNSSIAVASCGFSPKAIIVCIVIGAVVMLATLALGQRKYDGSIPLVGSCSLAISAACHRPEWDVDAALKPVQWGVIPAIGDFGERSDVGHCSFTSGTVEPLQADKEYAGVYKIE